MAAFPAIILPPKWFKIRFEQTTQDSHYWRRIGLADATEFVFENETKSLITNRFAVKIVGELSKRITRNCIAEKAHLVRLLKTTPHGPLNFNVLIPILNNFLDKVLTGKVWGKVFDLRHPAMLNVLRQTAETRNQIEVPYNNIPAISDILRAFNAFFGQFYVVLSAPAMVGLTCQLYKFCSAICVDILSHVLKITYTHNKYTNAGIRESSPMFDESVYDTKPNKDKKFHRIMNVCTLTKNIFKRDTHTATIWHQMLFAERYTLTGLVFDYHLKKRIPKATGDLLEAFLVGVQGRMRNFVQNNGFRRVADDAFPIPPNMNVKKFVGKVMRMETRDKMELFLETVLEPLLNDAELGIWLFRGRWVDYVMSICNAEEKFINIDEWTVGSVTQSADPGTFETLTNSDMAGRHALFFWIFAQLLRFVLKFAAHTLRVALRVTVLNRRLATVSYDGHLDIPDWKFAEIADDVDEDVPPPPAFSVPELSHVQFDPFQHDSFLEQKTGGFQRNHLRILMDDSSNFERFAADQ